MNKGSSFLSCYLQLDFFCIGPGVWCSVFEWRGGDIICMKSSRSAWGLSPMLAWEHGKEGNMQRGPYYQSSVPGSAKLKKGEAGEVND